MMIHVARWSEQSAPDRQVIELEGKTKNLVSEIEVLDGDGAHRLTLIPEFQGVWMRVRITVELIPEQLPQRRHT